MTAARNLHLATFPTELGWMALVGSGTTVKQLVFGHPSKAAAVAALRADLRTQAAPGNWWPAIFATSRSISNI